MRGRITRPSKPQRNSRNALPAAFVAAAGLGWESGRRGYRDWLPGEVWRGAPQKKTGEQPPAREVALRGAGSQQEEV